MLPKPPHLRHTTRQSASFTSAIRTLLGATPITAMNPLTLWIRQSNEGIIGIGVPNTVVTDALEDVAILPPVQLPVPHVVIGRSMKNTPP